MPLSLPRNFAAKYLTASVSIRSRIIAIAVIPVIGFLVNGIAFTSGESDVAEAFGSASRAAMLANASRELKASVSTMQMTAKDFAAQPNADLISAFEAAQNLGSKSLDTVAALIDPVHGVDVEPVRQKLWELKANFAELVQEAEGLGFTESSGIQSAMRNAAAAVESAINADMSWLSESDKNKLLLSLLNMRRYEAEYRLHRQKGTWELFFKEYRAFGQTLGDIVAARVMKDDLGRRVENYATTLAQWNRTSENIQALVLGIDVYSKWLLPHTERIISAAQEHASTASARLTASQQHTRTIIVWVGCLAVLIGLVFSWWIGRGITRPLNGLADVMKRLAAGDISARIPATQAKDELGEMARTVIVFRDNMIERERLATVQTETSREREQRGEVIAATIGRFEKSVAQALGKVREAAERLEITSTQLNSAADQVSAEARTAESRVGVASGNVTTAASSVEELAASISEIAGQANRSTEVASRAVNEARRTVHTMSELGNAATHIGEVVGLIQAIAGQTNLLALNATIEAARAGDAGKGFAVVASEVKSLAGQTAKATEDIAAQVGAIQSAVADAAQAIEQVNGIIEEISTIASTVAITVEEQNRAVASIAEGVNRASVEARGGADAMSRVAGASNDARATAADVKSLADTLSDEAASLNAEVRRFLDDVQAA